MEEEVWRPVVGYEELYEVSNLGKVRSVDRMVASKSSSVRSVRERILKPGYTNGGYEQCWLHKDGIVKTKNIHRLVAEAFIPNPNNYPCVNHKDENKLNNRVDNLEWCTVQYNANYGTRNQRSAISRSKKIRVDDIEYQSMSEAARSLNCCPAAITMALKNNRPTVKNHKIELVD